jgi:hypothetical protein
MIDNNDKIIVLCRKDKKWGKDKYEYSIRRNNYI